MNIADAPEKWDLAIVGGGITGAAILRESSRLKLRVLLIEREDFAWGTSSRSSKLIHGGLRYLKEGKFFLTRESVKEREKLLREAPGLVEPLGFWIPIYSDHGPKKWIISGGLGLYSLLAGKKQHRYYQKKDFIEQTPFIKSFGLKGGFRFIDGQTDDARLAIRLIQEAVESNPRALALNYTVAEEIKRDSKGWVKGVVVRDAETQESKFVSTKMVINATGVWAKNLHPSSFNIRPLRGGHLIFPRKALPISEAVSFVHPRDSRPIFALPWEGRILAGTTDVDHNEDLSREPAVTREEADYLLEGLNSVFPDSGLNLEQCLSSIAGIRPVISKAKRGLKPSDESREHIVRKDKGLVTVTGGKLTTFRTLALDALKQSGIRMPANIKKERIFNYSIEEKPENHKISSWQWRRLYGRYGAGAKRLVAAADLETLEEIPGCHTLWAELPYVAKTEKVRHLKDLLLLRLRIGLLTPEGGKKYLPKILDICRSALNWDQDRQEKEVNSYLRCWRQTFALPFN